MNGFENDVMSLWQINFKSMKDLESEDLGLVWLFEIN